MELQIYILLFCIPVVLFSWILPERWQLYPGVLAAGIFLSVFAPESLCILLLTTLATYYTLKYSSNITAAVISICIILFSIFLYFKLGYGKTVLMERLLPLGISYYSFRQIHYAIEMYKRKIPSHTLKEFLMYLFFLPSFLIGPIHRFPEFLKDIKRRRWDATLFSEGLERILYGFAKVIILGNYLMTDRGQALIAWLEFENYTWLATYTGAIVFTVNAYVQFAGFSDIAIGLSLLLGFRIMENFNAPFLATNISDFWQRWHISLSTWCRDYVYYPFYSMTRNPYIGVLFSMVLLGLWHSISWNYILWALAHVIAINVWHYYNHSSIQQKIHLYIISPKWIGRIITFHFVVFSFILVNDSDMNHVIQTYKKILCLDV